MKLIDKKLADLKAAQEKGIYTKCPRCGCGTMKPELYTNALSRAADIMVCDTCGMDEAKLAFMNAPMSLYQWAGLQPDRPDSDFKATASAEVWKRIEAEQMRTLCELYDRYERGGDSEEIRLEAFERCPGLTQLWTEPFQAKYSAADASILIRFRGTPYGIETCMSTMPNK